MLSRYGRHVINARIRLKPIETSKWRSTSSNLIDIHPEVRDALATDKPIVALESTIITHGMPYPQNLVTAKEVESIVRDQKAIPSTIAIINGRVKVGLDDEELESLAKQESKNVVKCSRRDLGYVLSHGLSGGTTVAGTSIIANLVGIKVFATGGIGGVHRDGHNTMDVSADLIELGRTSICVVSSGIKSILDIPRTLEYLETHGVCVATYQNESRDFPAFYTRSSGTIVPYNVNSSEEAALMIKSTLDLQLGSGILIGVPIPEKYAADEKLINDAIEYALIATRKKGIIGKDMTPFVLEAVSKVTSGKSLESNIGLIKNNALVAAQIAVALSKLTQRNDFARESFGDKKDSERIVDNVPVVIGASISDLCMTCLEDGLKLDGATYKMNSFVSGGGVGRNIAEGLYKLHGNVHLISAIGNDESGNSLNSYLPATATKGVIKDPNNATAMCAVICDKLGDCKLVLGDMKIHSSITSQLIMENEPAISTAPLIVMDANIEVNTMEVVLSIAKKHNKPVLFEPTDMRIADKPFQLPQTLTNQIKFISPNIYELHQIAQAFDKNTISIKVNTETKSGTLNTAMELLKCIDQQFDIIIVTLGSLGVLIASRSTGDIAFDKNRYILNPGVTKYRFYTATEYNNIVNVSGAGDSFTSGFVAAMLEGSREEVCVGLGFKAAQCALMSKSAVPEKYFHDVNDKDNWDKLEVSYQTIF